MQVPLADQINISNNITKSYPFDSLFKNVDTKNIDLVLTSLFDNTKYFLFKIDTEKNISYMLWVTLDYINENFGNEKDSYNLLPINVKSSDEALKYSHWFQFSFNTGIIYEE